jgi:hypothetical protein
MTGDTYQKASVPKPTRGVVVELDRTRYLRYSLGTLRKIREELGADALEKGVADEKLAKVLWYGLVEEDPSITTEQIEQMVDMENLQSVLDAVMKAMGYRAKATANVDPPAPSPAAAAGPAEPSAE